MTTNWLKGLNLSESQVSYILSYVEKLREKDKRELREIVESCKDDMHGTYDYDMIAEKIINYLKV